MIKKVSLLLMVMLIYIPKGRGNELEPNLNKYLFDENNFQFVDLTLFWEKKLDQVETAILSARTQHYDDLSGLKDSCGNPWIGTTLDWGLRGTSSIGQMPKSTDSLSLDKLILPLIIADISSKVSGDSRFVLNKHHLDFMLNNYFGKTDQPCFILFKFGWTKYKHDLRKYYGIGDETNSTRTPGISEDVAKWITRAYKNVVGVGVDLPSLDPGVGANYAAHNTLTEAGVYVVENVDLEQYLPDAWCTAVLLPQASRGPRAPARLVAVCPKHRLEEKRFIPWHRI